MLDHKMAARACDLWPTHLKTIEIGRKPRKSGTL